MRIIQALSFFGKIKNRDQLTKSLIYCNQTASVEAYPPSPKSEN